MKNENLIIKSNESGTWCIWKSNIWISLNDGNFTPFLPLLELSPNSLKALIAEAENESGSAQSKFPLQELLLFAIQTESVYWTEKAIICVTELNSVNEQIREQLINCLNNKRIDQKLRHKIRPFINYGGKG